MDCSSLIQHSWLVDNDIVITLAGLGAVDLCRRADRRGAQVIEPAQPGMGETAGGPVFMLQNAQ